MIFFTKYKTPIIIALVIIALIVGIYFYGKSKGTIKPVPLPNDDTIGSGASLSPSEASQVRSIATKIHDDMDGFNLFRDAQPYLEFAQLSDRLFVGVYNDFNNRYFSEGEGTLKEWINSEVFPYYFSVGETIDVINNKFARLNLQ